MQDTHEKSLSLVCCSYSGNRYLGVDKNICTLKNSNNKNLKFVLGITLSVVLMVALWFIVGVVGYRNKFRRKPDGVAAESSKVNLYKGQYCNMTQN